jgi:D-alanyl-D-alanine carboxypeptidase
MATSSQGNTLTWGVFGNISTWDVFVRHTSLVEEKQILRNSWIIENKVLNNDDSSITKFVNDKIHFTKIDYSPDDLVSIKWEYIIDTKWNQLLRNEANEYLQKMSLDFYKEFKVKLKIVSAYRSYDYQVWIKKRWCSDIFCAKPGYSEHQSWLAIDIFEATSEKEFLAKDDLKKYFDWMKKNAHKYWFHNSYQKWKYVDWYAVEPWHWRYLWVELAKELFEKNMTYAEYYKIYWEK